MKRCPVCNRTFDDETLTFCLDDGTPLSGGSNEPAQIDLSPASNKRDAPTTQSYAGVGGKETWNPSQDQIAEIQHYVAATTTTTFTKPRRVWPWIVAALAVLILVGTVIAIVMAR